MSGRRSVDTFPEWCAKVKDIFDYVYDRVENAVFASCVHPQIIGRRASHGCRGRHH